MTSLLRELVPVPIVLSDSRTITSRPASANDLATARPTTPAPIMTASTCSAGIGGQACAILHVHPGGGRLGSHYPSDATDGKSGKAEETTCHGLAGDRTQRTPRGGGICQGRATAGSARQGVLEPAGREPVSATPLSGGHRATERGISRSAHGRRRISPRLLLPRSRRSGERRGRFGKGSQGVSETYRRVRPPRHFLDAAIPSPGGVAGARIGARARPSFRGNAPQSGKCADESRPPRGGDCVLREGGGTSARSFASSQQSWPCL